MSHSNYLLSSYCLRFCDSLSETTIFTVFCFLLRTTSAIGGAAAETSCMSILIEKFPNNVGAVTVRYF